MPESASSPPLGFVARETARLARALPLKTVVRKADIAARLAITAALVAIQRLKLAQVDLVLVVIPPMDLAAQETARLVSDRLSEIVALPMGTAAVRLPIAGRDGKSIVPAAYVSYHKVVVIVLYSDTCGQQSERFFKRLSHKQHPFRRRQLRSKQRSYMCWRALPQSML